MRIRRVSSLSLPKLWLYICKLYLKTKTNGKFVFTVFKNKCKLWHAAQSGSGERFQTVIGRTPCQLKEMNQWGAFYWPVTKCTPEVVIINLQILDWPAKKKKTFLNSVNYTLSIINIIISVILKCCIYIFYFFLNIFSAKVGTHKHTHTNGVMSGENSDICSVMNEVNSDGR